MDIQKLQTVRLIILTIALSIFSESALANIAIWVSSSGGDWGTASNWSPAQIPTASTDVYIGSASAGTLLLQNSATASANSVTLFNSRQFSMQSGASLQVVGPFQIGSSPSGADVLISDPGTSLQVGSDVSGTLSLQVRIGTLTIANFAQVQADTVQVSDDITSGPQLNITSGALLITKALAPAGLTPSTHFDDATFKVIPSIFNSCIFNGYVVGNLVIDSGGLRIDSNGLVRSVDSAFTGQGGLEKIGNGTIILAQDNAYDGGTTITTGTLQIGKGGFTGSVTGDIVDNDTLAFNRVDTLVYGGVVSGPGQLRQIGFGTLILTNSSNYTGGTTIAAGTLQLGDGVDFGMVDGDITNNSALVFNEPIDTTYANVISGSGRMTQQGLGVLTLINANTYTGGTTVAAGTLQLGDGSNFGTVKGNINNNATLIFNEPGALTYSNIISGSGDLVQQGADVLTLNNINTYTGDTFVFAPLQLGDGIDFGSVQGNIQNYYSLIFNEPGDLTYSKVISGTGNLVQQGVGTLTLNNINTYTGGTIIAAGTLQLGDGSNFGMVQGDIIDDGTLIFNEPTSFVYNNVISGIGGIVKQGSGVMTLNSVNTNTGTTIINNGTLFLGDSAHPTATLGGDLTINPSGLLKGYGIIQGSVANDGIVSPGSSPGTITINGNYTQSPNGTLIAEVDSSGNSDLLTIGGVATLNGTIMVNAINDGFLENYLYTLITAGGGVVNKFSNPDINDIFFQGFLQAKLLYFPNMVQFIVGYNNDKLIGTAKTPNQKSVIKYLLTESTSTKAFSKLVASLKTEDELLAALDKIAAATYANQSLYLARLGNWFTSTLGDRCKAFPSSYRESCLIKQSIDNPIGGQWWFAAHGDNSHLSSGLASGLDTRAGDAALGYEIGLNRLTKIGIGVGYHHFSGDATVREIANVSGNLYQLGAYARHRTGNWLLGIGLDAGQTNQVSTSRKVPDGGYLASVSGEYLAHLLSEQAQVSYNLMTKPSLRIAPFLGIVGQQLKRNDFSERGVDTGFALHVNSATYRSTRSQLGTLIEMPSSGCMKPFASVSWEHEFSNQNGVFDANIINLDGQFHIEGETVGRNMASVKAGTSLFQGKNWNLNLLYEGYFGCHWQQNGATLEANVLF